VRVSSPVLRGPRGEIPPGYLPCAKKAHYASIIDALNVLCYRKDGGRSPGFALQDVIPNHHKLLWSKTTVVSVMGKGEAVTSSGTC